MTNIEKWYQEELIRLEEQKKEVMENECPCHYRCYGLKGYEDDSLECYDNNGDKESCFKCWNKEINV